MAKISQELIAQRAKGGFDEIHEVVRVFTLHDETSGVTVRVNIWRYYNETGQTYAAYYEREKEDGSWESADYGQILSGDASEESTIRRAMAFIRDAHKNHGKN